MVANPNVSDSTPLFVLRTNIRQAVVYGVLVRLLLHLGAGLQVGREARC